MHSPKKRWKSLGHIQNGDKVVSLTGNVIRYNSISGKSISKAIHFDSGQITHYTEWLGRNKTIPHGMYEEWYDSGEQWKTGHYIKGRRAGQWTEFDKKGRIIKSAIYKDSISYGYRNYYNIENGALSGYSPLLNDLLHGEVLKFNVNGDTTNVCRYNLGNLVSCEKDNLDSLSTNFLPEQKPYLQTDQCKNLNYPEIEKCAQKLLYNLIFKELSYPRREREESVQGNVIIAFVVERDGNMSNFEVIRGISNSMTKVSLDAIKSLPRWQPGIKDGEPVRVRYNLPLRFKLE